MVLKIVARKINMSGCGNKLDNGDPDSFFLI